MTILVGSDFSEHSAQALSAAAHLAARSGRALHLVHAQEPSEDGTSTASTSRLEERAARLRELGANVVTHIEAGPADEVLLALAGKLAAELIVIAALGTGDKKKSLGSRAGRVAQNTQVPVLLVRESAAFQAWTKGIRPLRILFGAGLSQNSTHAMAWIV